MPARPLLGHRVEVEPRGHGFSSPVSEYLSLAREDAVREHPDIIEIARTVVRPLAD